MDGVISMEEFVALEANRFAMTSTLHPCMPLADAPERWRANLFDNEGEDTFSLIWSRPNGRRAD